MVLYKCDICSKEFNRKSNYDSHKKRKKPCLILIANYCEKTAKNCQQKFSTIKSFKCAYCNTIFTKNYNLLAHIRNSCKVKKQQDVEKEDIYKKLLDEMEELKRINRENEEKNKGIEKKNNKIIKENKRLCSRIQRLEKNSKNISVTTTNINNGLMYNNNNVKIVAHGKEDFKRLDPQDVLKALNGFGTEIALTKLIHFNEKYPEYQNTYINNIKGKYAMVHDGDKWNLELKTCVIDGIYDKNRDFVEEKKKDYVKMLDESRVKSLERWLGTNEDDAKITKIKEQIKMLLYNEKDMIINSNQANLIEE